jgi:hypothetical protein
MRRISAAAYAGFCNGSIAAPYSRPGTAAHQSVSQLLYASQNARAPSAFSTNGKFMIIMVGITSTWSIPIMSISLQRATGS